MPCFQKPGKAIASEFSPLPRLFPSLGNGDKMSLCHSPSNVSPPLVRLPYYIHWLPPSWSQWSSVDMCSGQGRMTAESTFLPAWGCNSLLETPATRQNFFLILTPGLSSQEVVSRGLLTLRAQICN